MSWPGYLAAHRKRRADFRAAGATATDHGHPTAATANLSDGRGRGAVRADRSAAAGRPADAELFRAQMLTEMAKMSVDDGMVMQIHPGAFRNHNAGLFASHGRDKGADIPTPHRLRPRAEAAARPSSATSATCRSSSSRSTRAPTRANWRRSPAIIPA